MKHTLHRRALLKVGGAVVTGLGLAGLRPARAPAAEPAKGAPNAEKLGWLKDGAALVNTARGAVVDEDALYRELASSRLRAAFDVFWKEPYRGRLLELPTDRFLVTPHVASTCREFVTGTAEDFRAFLRTL